MAEEWIVQPELTLTSPAPLARKRKSAPRVRKGVPPMHVVAETNTVVSGLLWHGTTGQMPGAARMETIALSTSAPLLSSINDFVLLLERLVLHGERLPFFRLLTPLM